MIHCSVVRAEGGLTRLDEKGHEEQQRAVPAAGHDEEKESTSLSDKLQGKHMK